MPGVSLLVNEESNGIDLKRSLPTENKYMFFNKD